MSKKQLLKRELNLHGLEIPPMVQEAVGPLNQEVMEQATIAKPSPHMSDQPATDKDVGPDNPDELGHPGLTEDKDYTHKPDQPYEDGSKTLIANKLNKNNSKNNSRRAKRKRGGLDRQKWTTSLQPKFLEMLDVCSLREGFRDMNEYVEYILARHARKIGYNLEE